MILSLQLTVYQFFSPADFPSLNPGDTATVSVLRDGQPLDFGLTVMPAPDDAERGLIGIMRDNSFAYTPVMNFIEWDNPNYLNVLVMVMDDFIFHRHNQHASITNLRWWKIYSYYY